MKTLVKILVPFSFASILLVSACAISPQDRVDAQASVATPPKPYVHDYRCESGETITATYPDTGSTSIQYKGSNYNMQLTVSGSGSHYVGDELEWWTKGSASGSEGTLFRHTDDGTSGEILEYCSEP